MQVCPLYWPRIYYFRSSSHRLALYFQFSLNSGKLQAASPFLSLSRFRPRRDVAYYRSVQFYLLHVVLSNISDIEVDVSIAGWTQRIGKFESAGTSFFLVASEVVLRAGGPQFAFVNPNWPNSRQNLRQEK